MKNPATKFGTPTSDLHFIKFRDKNDRRYLFLDSSGAGTRLKVHALRYTTEQAEQALKALRAENPNFEFKGVDAITGKTTLQAQQEDPAKGVTTY